MTMPMFIAMSLCMLAGIVIFVFVRWIKNIKSLVTLSVKERKKKRKINILRTCIGLIFLPFVVAYFPEISEILLKIVFGIDAGGPITPVSALMSGMGVDRMIDQVIIAKQKKKQ